MNVEKISRYFFIVAAVVSILDGAFLLNESMSSVKFIVLIFSGIVVGVLKNTQEREFLLSGVSVVITGYILVKLLGDYFFVEGLGLMLLNFIIFLSSSLVIVGIQQVGNTLTFPQMFSENETTITKKSSTKKSNKKVLSKKKHPLKMSLDELNQLAFEHVWGIIILVAVAFTFIILLGEMFFDVGPLQPLFNALNIIITILFLIDLVILYEKSNGLKDFCTHNIFDIIAAIPTVGVLRGLKIIRAARVIKSLSKGFKTSKVLKMYKTSKFFSEKSYFNNLEETTKK